MLAMLGVVVLISFLIVTFIVMFTLVRVSNLADKVMADVRLVQVQSGGLAGGG